MTTRTAIITAKGGQGGSTVTAALAVLNPRASIVVDPTGDVQTILGFAEPGPNRVNGKTIYVVRETEDITEARNDLEQLADVFYDAGTTDIADYPFYFDAEHVLLVVRPCFLALRRALKSRVRPTGLIVLEEEGRSLNGTDTVAVLDVPIVATIPVDAGIARSVDSGLFGSNLPRRVAHALRPLAIA